MPLICTCLEGHRWEHPGVDDPEVAPLCPACGAPAAAVFADAATAPTATPTPFNPQMLSLELVREAPRSQAIPAAAPAPPAPAPLPQRQRPALPRGSTAGPVVLAIVLTSLAFMVLGGVGAVLWYQQSARKEQELADTERRHDVERQESAVQEVRLRAEVALARKAEVQARQAEEQARQLSVQRATNEQRRRAKAEQEAQQARAELTAVKKQIRETNDTAARKVEAELREKLAQQKLAALQARQKADAIAYTHCIALADWERRAGSIERLRRYLDACPPETPRHWEWHHLAHACGLPLLRSSASKATLVGLGFSADGKRLAAVATDGSVTIRNAIGVPRASFSIRLKVTASAAFSADGKRFAVAIVGKTGRHGLSVFTLDGKQRTLRGPAGKARCLALDAAGKRLILAHPKGVTVWEVETDREVFAIADNKQAVEAGAFSPDGKWLATAHRPLADPSEAVEIRIRNAATGKLTLTVRAVGQRGGILVFSPDGSLLASSTGSPGIHLWDPAATAPEQARVRFIGAQASAPRCLQFTPDSKTLVSADSDGVLRIWDARTGTIRRAFKAHRGSIDALAVSSDGTRLASAGPDRELRVWATQPCKAVLTLKGHAAKVAALAFSPDSKLLASASFDKSVRICEAATGKVIHTLKGHTRPVARVLFDPTGKRLATISAPAETPDLAVEVKVWDVAAGKELLPIPGQTGDGLQPVFSARGDRIALAGPGKKLKVWDCATGKVADRFDSFPVVGNKVHCVALAPSGERLAISDGKVFQVQTRKVGKDGKVSLDVTTFPGQSTPVKGVSWSADGKRLAVFSRGWLVTVWDMDKKQIMSIAGTRFDLRQASLSQDGKRLAIANRREVVLMDLDARREILHLTGLASVVMSVAFSPDGKRIAAGGLDGTLLIWDGSPHGAFANAARQ